MESYSAVVHPTKTNAAETDARAPARVIGKDDLIGWQRHSGAVCEDHERPGGPF